MTLPFKAAPALGLALGLAFLAAPTTARAQGLDRDTLLTEASATPSASTVRVAGVGMGEVQSNSSGSRVSGNVMWAPIENLAIDIGSYWQNQIGGTATARARYQILSQARAGLDLSAGVRYKAVGFHTDRSEVELLVAAGKSFGPIDVIMNGVFGFESQGGKDLEVKSFAGYRFNESLRAGVDGRIQMEVGDNEVTNAPKVGRDFDLTAGPALSWLVTDAFQVQAIAGVSAPKQTNYTAAIGILGASFDF